ncbi:hypothetical protein BDW02DRAFT_314873 [Decorospora gaudefroyi]|uniref:Post-SET domain-containing protein n=1 Tax=Decorospora gaudefroyi TaxID=184978 RepID=A0A6A5K1G6_9PLEO|nr:hypothetical protein BDW02DRAFT_314873 [Decorospora gaudefroyi]
MAPAVVSSTAPPAATQQANGKSSTRPIITPSTATDAASQIPGWVKPDLTHLLRVEHNPGSYTSRSVSLVNLPAGAIFARITSPTPATVAYSSVQASRDLHIELNCDLVYINHSCKPSLVFDMERWEVRVAENGPGLKEGDELTFFYPSTEWDMAQPFECLCKADGCKGKITGAREMDRGVLAQYWLNKHIEDLLAERDGKGL